MKILMVIAPEGYQDIEYGTPKELFESKGIEVITASKKAGICRGKLGGEAEAEISVAEADANNFDAVVFVGGPGMASLLDDHYYTGLAKRFFESGKVTSAICISPSVLANAGLLEGRKATAFPSQEKHLKSKGAVWTGEAVARDGKIITANGPNAAGEFGEEIVEGLNK